MSVQAPAAAGTVPASALRRALGRFATGVALVTAPGDEALVVNSFTSVSLDPPLVCFGVGRASLTWRRMRRAPLLGVNVLPDTVTDVRERARPGADRLAGLTLESAAEGVPELRDALAFLVCRTLEERPAGDHLLVLCEVLEASARGPGRPLVFFAGLFGTFAPP